MNPESIVASRFDKLRALGSFSILDEAGRAAAIATGLLQGACACLSTLFTLSGRGSLFVVLPGLGLDDGPTRRFQGNAGAPIPPNLVFW